MRKTKLLSVDNFELFREGVVEMLRANPKITIESVPCTVPVVAKIIRVYKPDVVLLDIENSESTKVISYIRQVLPGAHIIILTHSKEGVCFYSAINAGATGYIFKDISYENLLKTIDLVARGKLVVGSDMTPLVVGALKFLDAHKHTAEPRYISLLSEQEKVILCLVARETTNKSIASILHIAESTVKVHVHNILAKLQARTRLEASISAIEGGLECDVTETGTN